MENISTATRAGRHNTQPEQVHHIRRREEHRRTASFQDIPEREKETPLHAFVQLRGQKSLTETERFLPEGWNPRGRE